MNHITVDSIRLFLICSQSGIQSIRVFPEWSHIFLLCRTFLCLQYRAVTITSPIIKSVDAITRIAIIVLNDAIREMVLVEERVESLFGSLISSHCQFLL